MSVLSYLQQRSSDAVLSTNENNQIAGSITTIQGRIYSYFGAEVSEHFRFGSSVRGTILPRSMDSRSDIDYMIVFKEGGYRPQTYLNRLRSFVEKYYSTSEIYQSSPTIVLSLNHIKFELVPALTATYFEYAIPSGSQDWQYTDPNAFNAQLTAKNNLELYLIKPTIRLAKFWNARNGYIFDSFELEKWIVNQSFYGHTNQKEYLFRAFDLLSASSLGQTSSDKLNRAKKIVESVRKLEREGYPITAETEVKRLIPE